MIINGNDRFIGRSLEHYGVWAEDDINIIVQICAFLLQRNSHITMYDVGANIGTHTVALAKTFGDRISIRAFEAQRQVYYMLCGNIAMNGISNVECELAAVSDGETKSLSISLPDYSQLNNFGGVELLPPTVSDNQDMIKNNIEEVKCILLDQFHEAVDFIKMDIEGMEHLALAGAVKTLATRRPICFVEMAKTNQEKVKQIFTKAKYNAYTYTQEDWIFVPGELNLEFDVLSKAV